MQIYDIAKQSILSYFQEEIQLLKIEKFQNIIVELKKLLNEIESINNFLIDENLRISILNKAIGFNRHVSPFLYYIYNMKDYSFLEERREKIEQILFEKTLLAYERLNEIRILLTKEKITYQIAAGSKSTKKEYIAQGSFTFDQIEEALYLQRRAEQYSIRLRINQTKLKNLAKQKKVQLEQISFKENPSSLYSAVFRWYTGERLGKKGAGNWGNFYEAYRYLYYKFNRNNDIIPSEEDLEESFKAVLSGGGKEGSFMKGADQGFEQDKASFGGQPTLTSVKTIISTLKDTITVLENFIKTKDTQELERLLVKENIDYKIQEKAREEAIQNIRDFLKDFQTK